MKIELAKTGTWNGTTINPRDLQDCVEMFNPNDRVPIIKGHDSTWDDSQPADGWINSVSVEGEILIGEIELSEEMQAAFDAGQYQNWSVGMSYNETEGKWYLHHLAFLGGTPPKIKGLQVLEMSDKKLGKCRTLTFSDTQIIEEKEPEKADDNKKENEGGNADMANTDAEKKLKDAEEALAAEKAKTADLEKKNKEFSDKAEKQKAENRKAEVDAHTEALAGKMPKEKADAIAKAFSDAAIGKMLLFSDTDEKGDKISGAIAAVIDGLKSMPKLASDKAHNFGDDNTGIKASIKFSKI